MPSIKPNLIILSYYDPGSGFFTVISNIAKTLQHYFSIHYVGLGYAGSIRQEDHWILYPGLMDKDDFAANYCVDLALQLKSGSLLIINDLWISRIYKPVLSRLKDIWTLFAYTAIDGKILDPDIVRDAEFLDTLVVYTHFAKAEIARICEASQKTTTPIQSIPVQVIPHGIDNTFYKLSDDEKKSARLSLFANHTDWQDSFIILNANKISPRKRVDLTLKAFHLFSIDKPDVRLYLHDSHIAPEYHSRLIKKLEEQGMTHKVMISPATKTLMSKQQLNQLYNACDIGINTSAGEGWGLVNFEHAATGAAQIVPDHSACTELWKNNAELIAIKEDYLVQERADTLMKEIHIPSLVDALNTYYYRREYRELMAEKAYRMVTGPDYQWNTIGNQWASLLMPR